MSKIPWTKHEDLCDAIQAALQIAEDHDHTLVSALLMEALDAAACTGDASSNRTT